MNDYAKLGFHIFLNRLTKPDDLVTCGSAKIHQHQSLLVVNACPA